MSRIGKSIETESKLVVARVWGWGEYRVTAKGYRVSLGDDENCSVIGSAERCTILWIY